MHYKTKSVVIGRTKRTGESYPVFVSLFSVNDPHLTNKVPTDSFEYQGITKVIITGLEVGYLPLGNDLVINHLSSIDVEKKADLLIITGEQEE
ncbi:hypothetical protein HZB02_06880 [Candidatus Woesearchaeota archaeon]|nr:hypothetical protein [Candidatus Woesearchaeota archaeon]